LPVVRDPDTKGLLGLAGSLAAATALSGCLVYRVEKDTTTVRRSFDAADVDELRVPAATDAVTLETAGDDADAVEVRADKRARGSTSLSDLELRTETAEGVLRVSTTVPPVTGIGGGSVDLRIGVPSTVSVEQVTAEDGSVTVEGTGGVVTTEAGDGRRPRLGDRRARRDHPGHRDERRRPDGRRGNRTPGGSRRR
jgi:hypothetical protein